MNTARKLILLFRAMANPELASDPALPTFTYDPLPSVEHIRLLTIDSATDGIFNCTLDPVHLDEAKDCYCLSYCWGDGIADQALMINGGKFKVTANLSTAIAKVYPYLDRARHQSSRIWIDAICINQRDNEEKSQQVRRMGRIFHGVTQVLVWLGDEADDSNRFMKVLQ